MSQRNWQTTLRILLLAAVVILIVSLSNCARKKSGIYVAKDLHPAPFIELKSDGTFYVQRATGGGVSGTYEVDGDTVTVKFQTGVTEKAFFQNDGSFVMGGFTFVRKN